MKLKELFDSPAEFTPLRDIDGFIFSFFEVEGKEYIAVFHNEPPSIVQAIFSMFNNVIFPFPFRNKTYSFAFGLLKEDFDKSDVINMLYQKKIVDITTGTGNAPKVIATIGHIVVDFFNNYHPNMIFYGAQEKNRYVIYRFLSRELVRIFTDYKFQEINHMYIIHKPF